MLDLSDMKGIDIDVEGRTAWARPALTAAEVTEAVGAHGLAIGFGDTGSVGIGGITLGGGVGYLVRKFGLTIDALLAAEVVTADGERLEVDAEHHPDLFWAIRGGGGNFGVATRFKYRLHELPETLGGLLILPANAETVAGFIAAAEAAPDELSTIANVMPCPPLPFVPAEHHGQLVIFGLITYGGDPAAGERARRAAPRAGRAAGRLSHRAAVSRRCTRRRIPTTTRRRCRGRCSSTAIDGDVAAQIMGWLETSDASMRVAQLRVLGGAMARVPDDATAFAHRSSRIMVNVAAFYEGPEDKARAARRGSTSSAPTSNRRTPAPTSTSCVDEGEERIRAAYPGDTWDRLAAVKARYDPTNLFRLNQNIPPVG